MPYQKSAAIYDAIYGSQDKDYASETAKLLSFIRQHKRSAGNRLLDVGCGTGVHLSHLAGQFACQGLDKSDEMLALAREKLPQIPLHWGDMADFDLGERFDVITCLFSAIGYTETLPRLNQTIGTFARHLLPGGVALVEPWFGPGVLNADKVYCTFVDQPELKVARMNLNRVEGRLSYLDFHYLVGTPAGIESFCETHVMGIFTHEEYMQAFTEAGLRLVHDADGLDGRGLYIGIQEA